MPSHKKRRISSAPHTMNGVREQEEKIVHRKRGGRSMLAGSIGSRPSASDGSVFEPTSKANSQGSATGAAVLEVDNRDRWQLGYLVAPRTEQLSRVVDEKVKY